LRYSIASRRAEAPLRYFLVAAAAAGVVLRFVRLGGQSLWVDEAITLKNSFVGGHLAFSGFLSTLQGPLVVFIMHFWASLSSNDAFLRIPFAIAGGLTVWAFYLLGRSLYDSWTTLHTVFVASLSPILVWYSQEIRGYSFAVLFSVLMTYFFIQWLARPTARNAIYYGIMVFAGLMTNLSAGFVACAHLMYLILVSGKRKLVGRWMVTIFIVLLAFSPWVREIIVRAHPVRAAAVPSAEPLKGGGGLSIWALPYALFTDSVGYTLGPSVRALQADRARALADNAGWIVATGAVFGIMVVAGVTRLVRTNRNLLLLVLLWLLVPIVAVVLLAARNVKVFNVRYALVGIPAYIMLVGQGLAAISRSRYWFLVLVFAALIGISLVNYFHVATYGKDDARGAARLIQAGLRPGDVVVGVYATEALDHYLEPLTPVAVFEASDVASPGSMSARCETLAAGSTRLWLVLCREGMVDPRGAIKNWFDHNLKLESSQSFPGVRVFLYDKRSG